MLMLYSATHVQLFNYYVDFLKKRHFIEKIHIKSQKIHIKSPRIRLYKLINRKKIKHLIRIYLMKKS